MDSFAKRVARDDPATAISWAESIVDPQKRVESLIEVGQAWSRQDYEAALAWVQTTDLPEDARQSILNPPQEERDGRRRGGGFGQRR